MSCLGTPRQTTYIRWGWKIANWYRNRESTENDGADEEQQLADVQRSTDEEQPQINEQEIAAGKLNTFYTPIIYCSLGYTANFAPLEAFSLALDRNRYRNRVFV